MKSFENLIALRNTSKKKNKILKRDNYLHNIQIYNKSDKSRYNKFIEQNGAAIGFARANIGSMIKYV